MKKKHLKDLPVLTVALFLSLCMHGCSTEEIAQNEYLHVDIPENNAFSALQLETLSVAYQRLDEFVSIENGIFILNVSAKDVNISEELLRFIKAGIDARNNLIEIEKTLTRNGVELPIPVTPFGGPIDNPGTNPDNPDSGGGGRIEFYYGPGYYQTIAYLTHDQAIALFGFMQGTLNYTDWVAMISALVPPITLQSFLMGVYSKLLGQKWEDIEDMYYSSGGRGIEINEIIFTMTAAGSIHHCTVAPIMQ